MVLGIILSLDDYLLCMAIGLILTSAAQRQGFSKEKTTYLINIIAVSYRIVPFLQSKQMVVTRIGDTEINIANIMSPPYIFSFYYNEAHFLMRSV